MAALEDILHEDWVRNLVKRGVSHLSISQHLKAKYPNTRGISERSVRRYCQAHGIARLTNEEIDGFVTHFVSLYGHHYGRALMQGSIRSNLGVTYGAVSQRRVSNSLRRIAPEAFDARTRDILQRTNPVPYYAPFFGYKVHMDQNEKIGQRFGCTHVALIDGCSRMICGYASMEIKNPILIYEFVFRPALLQFGLWNQLRVDHGQEFVLCIFVQDLLKGYRLFKDKEPWKQTTSTENNVIERFWPEVNVRVNYPIKRALNRIVEEFDWDMSNPVLKYSISWVTIFIADHASRHLIDSWNYHRVPGANGCIPIDNMFRSKRTVELVEPFIPTVNDAVRMYESLNGRLTRNSQFGTDPLVLDERKYNLRRTLFLANQPSGEIIFSDVVHSRIDSLKLAIEFFYDITCRLARL